ncbi:hypothetical protein M231_00358 [Tremella mesenterica]|uniref:UDP-glycosyltransferases domain-containing protein n=1 Tax=Tremella mesenterica TaxID=5217 RepID=A0A4Q1BW63_TREME|nr:uncharacterized protein TREMEDRAFT_63493 [Tremella mesenterica DSM 1558]EIW68320.1 hypothetical protein TREMEDRAFT_63493 [Tremella mesenterica DSM 1558]RXK42368.1 hypothetical protein M231_00358 [Tremella mesenterica]
MTNMTEERIVHSIVIPLGLWGHSRPLLHTCLNLLVSQPSLHITILLEPTARFQVGNELVSPALRHLHTPNNISTIEKDFTSNTNTNGLGNTTKSPMERLQLIVVESYAHAKEAFDPSHLVTEATSYAAMIPTFLEHLLKGNEKVVAVDNKFRGIKVTSVIFDLFQSFVPELMTGLLKTLHLDPIPLLGFCPSNAAAAWHHFATEASGGFIAITESHVKVDLANGRDIDEAYAEHGFASYGVVKQIPGLPPKYDYEYRPLLGAAICPIAVTRQVSTMYTSLWHPACSGLILPTIQELEEECHKALEVELGKPVYMVGIQFPRPMWQHTRQPIEMEKPEDCRVIEFLDGMEKKHGRNSVVYISFGSLWYPSLRLELIVYILDSLAEAVIPYVFAYATWLVTEQPKEIQEKIAAYPNGCMVKFAPQWQVLQHPAVGFAVTHCGSNSTAECIMTETPIVAMPFAADQGEFASMICDIYKAGITLRQTSTFKEKNANFDKYYDGTRIIGTEAAIKDELKHAWTTLKGLEGEVMRNNMRHLRSVAETSRTEGKGMSTMSRVGQCL